nr:retrovirus-related Pol polyprotein from transposon TNT 1-94 [Tanacetum cinerariifolium]
MKTQTSNTLHNAIMEDGSKDRPPMLIPEAKAVQIILTGIDNDIYSTVDVCLNACEMWKAIKRNAGYEGQRSVNVAGARETVGSSMFKEDKEDMSRVLYSSAVGSLMYAMVCNRPDLAHAVSVVSRYIHNPGKMNWKAIKCILCNLKGTSNIGLSFKKGRASPNRVAGYVNSSYAGDLDARKSISMYIFSHCDSAIS